MTAYARPVAAVLVVIAALAASAAPSAAQELSLGALIERLDRLERDLSGVQRQLAREGVPPAGAAAQGGDAQLAARQEIRIGELEQQIRALTGQVEQAQHSLRMLAERVEALSADIEPRLAAIEQRLAGAGPAVAAAPAAPSGFGGAGTTTVVDAEGATVVGQDPNTERYETMGVLGTLPVDEAAADDGAATEMAAAPPAAAAAPATPEAEYEDAYRLLAQADYDGAEAALDSFIAGHPDHPLVGNAYYWLGETHYVRNDYQRAAVAFARGYKGAPGGNKAADNLLKLGMSFLAMDKTDEACATFAKLLQDHSGASAQLLGRVEGERTRAGCG